MNQIDKDIEKLAKRMRVSRARARELALQAGLDALAQTTPTPLYRAREMYVWTHWGDRTGHRERVLQVADPREGNFTTMGELYAVTYETAKGKGPRELWEHKFKSPKPLLVFSAVTARLIIAGGRYTVTDRGIEG
jgi:hypothetical protein